MDTWLWLLFPFLASSWYLPGIAPHDYMLAEHVELKVDKLSSTRTQLPYRYYDMPFCRPQEIRASQENLGQLLEGHDIWTTPYELRMLVNTSCKLLCTLKISEAQKDDFVKLIQNSYVVNFIVDGLPAKTLYQNSFQYDLFDGGFPVGISHPDGTHRTVFNHLVFHLSFHYSPDRSDAARIVGFIVEPKVRPLDEANCEDLDVAPTVDLENCTSLTFTYDVIWTESTTTWSERWDNYVSKVGTKIRWYATIQNMCVVACTLCLVATILVRTLTGHIQIHNSQALPGDRRWRWTLLADDVFRRPPHAKLLAVSVGSGLQILSTAMLTLIFALLGTLTPNQGSLLQAILLSYSFTGVVAGYVASRLLRAMRPRGRYNWFRLAVLTSVGYPGICFMIFSMLNMLNWSQKASSAVPVMTILALLLLWLLVLVPMVFLGSYAGARGAVFEEIDEAPPRRIPKQPWYRSLWMSMAISGLVLMSCAFTELFYAIFSIWQHTYYTLFSFFAMALLMLVLESLEISILITYCQLNSENHQWWWRSFLCTASVGIYVFIYSAIYFFYQLELNTAIATCLYFGYMLIISFLVALVSGACGFFGSFIFVHVIYRSIHVRATDLCTERELSAMSS